MVTKRDFITGAAAVAAVAGGGSWAAAGVPGTAEAAGTGGAAGAGESGAAGFAGAPGAGRLLPQLVVFNERYADARAFADALGAEGVATLPIAGDMGTLWYATLRRRVAAGASRIAGLGTPTDFFILRELGREVRLRVHYEGLHDRRGCGTLTHTVRGCDPARIAHELEAGAENWSGALAQAVQAAAAAAGAADSIIRTRVAARPDHPGMLVSWILA